MCDFRTLRAEEIDVRVQQVTGSSRGVFAMLLLYKDARVDMAMLDEKFGVFGWQREHSFKDGRNYCKVSIYNPDTKEWIAKEDVGTESNTEAEKGQASDAFKRACVNIGIGRELYTSPKIVVQLNEGEYKEDGTDKFGNKKYKINSWVKFRVAVIDYSEGRSINKITITDQNHNIRFSLQ